MRSIGKTVGPPAGPGPPAQVAHTPKRLVSQNVLPSGENQPAWPRRRGHVERADQLRVLAVGLEVVDVDLRVERAAHDQQAAPGVDRHRLVRRQRHRRRQRAVCFGMLRIGHVEHAHADRRSPRRGRCAVVCVPDPTHVWSGDVEAVLVGVEAGEDAALVRARRLAGCRSSPPRRGPSTRSEIGTWPCSAGVGLVARLAGRARHHRAAAALDAFAAIRPAAQHDQNEAQPRSPHIDSDDIIIYVMKYKRATWAEAPQS